MKVEVELSPKQVAMCIDWHDYWRDHNAGDDFAISILCAVAKEVCTYDEVYLEAVNG